MIKTSHTGYQETRLGEPAPGKIVATATVPLFSCRCPSEQAGLFTVILVGARSSELINTYLRHHWREFSRQNYFDEHGVFMGVMWAGPLLLLGFAMLVSKRTAMKTVKHMLHVYISSQSSLLLVWSILRTLHADIMWLPVSHGLPCTALSFLAQFQGYSSMRENS